MASIISIGIDNYAVTTSVIRYLHRDLGLTDFWFAMGPADNYENQERTKALADYCKANGLPWGEDRVHAESFIAECGIHAFRRLLKLHDGKLPQAVICSNDHIAMGICRAAEESGFQVPRDFYITGFDNTQAAVAGSPQLTTVDQQSWNMGNACVSAMRRAWRGEEVPERIFTPTKLILRESTGATAPAPAASRPERGMDYLDLYSSETDFRYKLSSMQYRFPGCDSIEEICQTFIECFSVLDCDGIDLILDSRLFDPERSIGFTEQIGQMRDVADGMPVEGYADTLELLFSWRSTGEMSYPHRKVGSRLYEWEHGEGENCLLAPIHFMSKTVGYLCIHNCLALMRIKGVSTVVSTLTMALRTYFAGRNLAYVNHVLSGISMKDGLTGLYNRLGYHELAYSLFRETVKTGDPLAILFMDLDRLKQINDNRGHEAGDLAIKCVANTILRIAPQNAVCVRYGGDEFLLLVPRLTGEGADELLGAFGRELPAQAKALGIPDEIDVSTGFVLTERDSGRSLDDYVREADVNMYRCKKAKKALRS